MGKDPQRLDEFSSLIACAADGEAEHCAAATRKQLLRELMVGMPGKLRITHRCDKVVRVEKGDNLACVVHVALHPQRQCLDPLQNLEGRHRRHAGSEVAYAFAARTQQECRGGRFVGEDHVVETAVGLAQGRKLGGALPVEATTVDQQAADHHAVPGKKFRRRVIDQIGAVVERPHEIRCRKRRIDQQR